MDVAAVNARDTQCPVCDGTGWIEGTMDDIGNARGRWCHYCNGSGSIEITQQPEMKE